MKTKLILLATLFTLVSTYVSAQFYKPKKVAITEVVDESGEVNDGTKKFIRTAITDAITNSEGYVGYDQISFTTLEVNFGKTGNITSAILSYVQKQEGDYILVSDITTMDKRSVLISARIVKVSDGKIVASSSVTTAPNLDSLRSACNELCYKLVGAL